ncbi:MAG: hypothetical protein F6K56_18950 [Moorea sp. SIO3G5]|nr:hypothetical protein [Moorena sp. SIO3G5]
MRTNNLNLNKIQQQKLELNHKEGELESSPPTHLTKLQIGELESVSGSGCYLNWG